MRIEKELHVVVFAALHYSTEYLFLFRMQQH